jgi:chromosomal replication initiator protein
MSAALAVELAQLRRRLDAIERGAPPAPPLPIARIVAAVAAHFDIPIPLLLGEGRAAHLALARQTAMALVRELHGTSLPRIGAAFGRDHTTVLHAVTKVSALRRTDPVFAAQFDALALTLSELEA